MPLRDHFHGPLYPAYHWESFQSHWASVLTNHLNATLLPSNYFAAPYVKMGVEVEIDVGTFEQGKAEREQGGAATTVYAPPAPGLTAELNFTALDTFEIQIRPEGEARLAGAIEFLSPANKDRPGNRRAFSIKCASYLHQGASLLIVDMVTTRRANLHAELLELLQVPKPLLAVGPLYCVSYRTRGLTNGAIKLDAWGESLTQDSELPTMPLWLAADFVIPIELEKTYQETGETLRLPGF